MISSRSLIIGLVGTGCIVAAGVGGYVAVRSGGAAPQAAPASVAIDPVISSAPPAVVHPSEGAPTPAEPSKPGRQVADAGAQPRAPRAAPPTTPARQAPAPIVEQEPEVAAPVEAVQPAGEPWTHATAPDLPVVAAVLPPPPPPPALEEVTVKADGVIGIQLTSTVSSASAKVEDRVTGRVTRDVTVDGRVVIPAGATVDGSVTSVQRGGKFREPARLSVRFNSLVLNRTVHVPIQTETIVRVGDAPTGRATSKIGASAAIGAIIGGVLGGKKGAAIGGSAGAAGGTAAVMASDTDDVVLAAGTSLTLRLTASATFEIEREP